MAAVVVPSVHRWSLRLMAAVVVPSVHRWIWRLMAAVWFLVSTGGA
ncbi:hypothetical protein LEMLEM_LOCUS3618 [Lemmus lemmus]